MLGRVPHDTFFDANNNEAEFLQLHGARCVEQFLFLIIVRRSINFDDERRLVAEEIDDILAGRRLASESPAVELIAAQALPEQSLCN